MFSTTKNDGMWLWVEGNGAFVPTDRSQWHTSAAPSAAHTAPPPLSSFRRSHPRPSECVLPYPTEPSRSSRAKAFCMEVSTSALCRKQRHRLGVDKSMKV
ncbi:hypothetical protein R5R35_006601 [Gryllus longicercus]|uniref:Uncharacterized protein n=1 Tax=Gryllus longicercus TaxID=2509291 RepID=A0AAN9VWI3_9ORTH